MIIVPFEYVSMTETVFIAILVVNLYIIFTSLGNPHSANRNIQKLSRLNVGG